MMQYSSYYNQLSTTANSTMNNQYIGTDSYIRTSSKGSRNSCYKHYHNM